MDTFQHLRAFVVREFGLPEDSISRTSTLAEILGSHGPIQDSLDQVGFVMALEEYLSVRLPDAVAESFNLDWRLQELADLIDSR